MKHVDLLMNVDGVTSLESFARLLFEVVGAKNFEERESSHYVEGRYFIATTDVLFYKVMRSDDEDHKDLPYWVRVSAAARNSTFESSEIDALASRLIRSYHFRVARINNFGQVSEKRFDYAA